MSASAEQFVGRATFAALSARPVAVDAFDPVLSAGGPYRTCRACRVVLHRAGHRQLHGPHRARHGRRSAFDALSFVHRPCSDGAGHEPRNVGKTRRDSQSHNSKTMACRSSGPRPVGSVAGRGAWDAWPRPRRFSAPLPKCSPNRGGGAIEWQTRIPRPDKLAVVPMRSLSGTGANAFAADLEPERGAHSDHLGAHAAISRSGAISDQRLERSHGRLARSRRARPRARCANRDRSGRRGLSRGGPGDPGGLDRGYARGQPANFSRLRWIDRRGGALRLSSGAWRHTRSPRPASRSTCI